VAVKFRNTHTGRFTTRKAWERQLSKPASARTVKRETIRERPLNKVEVKELIQRVEQEVKITAPPDYEFDDDEMMEIEVSADYGNKKR